MLLCVSMQVFYSQIHLVSSLSSSGLVSQLSGLVSRGFQKHLITNLWPLKKMVLQASGLVSQLSGLVSQIFFYISRFVRVILVGYPC